MSEFKAGDRVFTIFNAWTLQDGTRRPAYGRIAAKPANGTSHVEFDMGAEGKITLLMDDGSIEPDPQIPTLAENVARARAERAARIAAAGYSLPGDRIEAALDWWEREKAFARSQAMLGEEPKPARDGQANTSGIKRDFEPGGLEGVVGDDKPKARFRAGQAVRTVGIRDLQYNGLVGLVLGETDRVAGHPQWNVRFDGPGGFTLSLHENNLVPVAGNTW